jgi:hypothetical protein
MTYLSKQVIAATFGLGLLVQGAAAQTPGKNAQDTDTPYVEEEVTKTPATVLSKDYRIVLIVVGNLKEAGIRCNDQSLVETGTKFFAMALEEPDFVSALKADIHSGRYFFQDGINLFYDTVKEIGFAGACQYVKEGRDRILGPNGEKLSVH